MPHLDHKTLHEPLDMMISGISYGRKPASHEEYAAWNDSFCNQTLSSPLDMMDVIAGGYAYTAVHRNNVRKKDNWEQAQYISIDLEKHPDAALDCIEKNEFFASYGFLSYTTCSHTAEAPRSRALFILDQPVRYPKQWNNAARAICGFFGAAVDPSSPELSRAFLGNVDTDCRVYGRILPWDVGYVLAQQQLKLDEMLAPASRRRDTLPPTMLKGATLESMNRWLDELRHTPEGQRNVVLNRIAFLVGRYIVGKGKLDETQAVAMLVSAALTTGLEEFEAIRTTTVSVRKGASQ